MTGPAPTPEHLTSEAQRRGAQERAMAEDALRRAIEALAPYATEPHGDLRLPADRAAMIALNAAAPVLLPLDGPRTRLVRVLRELYDAEELTTLLADAMQHEGEEWDDLTAGLAQALAPATDDATDPFTAEEVPGTGTCAHGKPMEQECRHCFHERHQGGR